MPVFVLKCFKIPGHGCKYIQGWIKLLTCNVLPTSTPLRLYFFLRANMKLTVVSIHIKALKLYLVCKGVSVKLKVSKMSARQLRIIASESYTCNLTLITQIPLVSVIQNVKCSSKSWVGLAGEAGIFQTNYRNAKLSVSSASL